VLEYFSEPTLVALIGGVGGVFLGLAARLGRFCTLGAIEDYFYGGSSVRLRMWGTAIGTAIFVTFTCAALGLIDLGQTAYLSQSLNLPAAIIGGLMFGYGMALSGNCGFGALSRLGGGDLRSFVIVLVMGLAAYMVMSGPFAKLRITLFPHHAASADTTGIAHWLSGISGVDVEAIGIAVGLTVLVISLITKSDDKSYFWGGVVGLAIASGWIGTTFVSQTGFDGTPVVSHTFSAPIGETMLYAMTASGNTLSFAVGSVLGVLVGAFIGSLFKGHFRWEACEDPRELRRQIAGAALLGVGAVIATGCSIGQGLSAFSTLAISAPITLAAIFVGAYIGLRQLIEGFQEIN